MSTRIPERHSEIREDLFNLALKNPTGWELQVKTTSVHLIDKRFGGASTYVFNRTLQTDIFESVFNSCKVL